MKYLYFLIIGCMFLASCETESQNKSELNDKNFNEMEVINSFDSLNLMAEQIINNGFDPKLQLQNIKLGRELYKLSSLKIQDKGLVISDSLKECLYQWAALGAEASEHYNDAITYFHKAQRNFPKSVNAPKYLHNIARIIEDKLHNKKSARLAYEELIELYPNHPLSKNSKIYLENVFDKTDAELIELIQIEK